MLQSSQVNKYDYDIQSDSIFFYGSDKKYRSSIDLDGIILDVSEDDYIMGIEILDVSEKFNVSKMDLSSIKHFEANIEISKENIKISMEMRLFKRNGLINRCLDTLGLNSMNLPVSTQGIALNC
ncbi:hypothetical protein MSLAZ_1347 [Methanosarcina lacustris Z-7289]|jgi:uncharacterized protein YuzE|uniref:DUF2283 domain-containing protein n=1 Tax=Methanosarcina lacustris Z-7289 TaxID=1434111 RepID=A0A0E3S6I3_9EURY|nr:MULTISPECIES: DUF2283 domain-containing protein [Methanosarcina]AKB74608.1 hypothetical protein MSLAZ_1347 [Methanosarcina lacustris Z-7289]MDD3248080.1 DUF2283 domain-containing protein [Methanosarcina sp.]MDD4248916.1 DUF2283 domain-containing protein [Methanosarcina sp.]